MNNPLSKKTRLEHYRIAKAYYENFLIAGTPDTDILAEDNSYNGSGIGMCFVFSLILGGWSEKGGCCNVLNQVIGDGMMHRDHLLALLEIYPELSAPTSSCFRAYNDGLENVKERLEIVNNAINTLQAQQ